MRQTIEFAEYTPDTGLRLSWDPGASIAVRQDGSEIVVSGNRPGFVTFARHLLTLAQPGVPHGAHMHLDEFAGLEPGSTELIIELVEQERNSGSDRCGVRLQPHVRQPAAKSRSVSQAKPAYAEAN